MSRRVIALAAGFAILAGGFLAGRVLASAGLSLAQFGFQAPAHEKPAPPETPPPQPAAPSPPADSKPVPATPDKPVYWIDVDVSDQTVRVMKGNEVFKEMSASTGVKGHETPLGTFEIQNRGAWFFSEKYKQGAKYWVSFKDWGVYLFHSLAMDKDQKVIEEEAAKLGQPASHGCVRLKVEDAKWIYDNVAQRSKVVIHE